MYDARRDHPGSGRGQAVTIAVKICRDGPVFEKLKLIQRFVRVNRDVPAVLASTNFDRLVVQTIVGLEVTHFPKRYDEKLRGAGHDAFQLRPEIYKRRCFSSMFQMHPPS
jgi:hypothetical protein